MELIETQEVFQHFLQVLLMGRQTHRSLKQRTEALGLLPKSNCFGRYTF